MDKDSVQKGQRDQPKKGLVSAGSSLFWMEGSLRHLHFLSDVGDTARENSEGTAWTSRIWSRQSEIQFFTKTFAPKLVSESHLLTSQTKKTCYYLSTWQQAATQALRLRWIHWEQILEKENQCPHLGKKNRIKAEGDGSGNLWSLLHESSMAVTLLSVSRNGVP